MDSQATGQIVGKVYISSGWKGWGGSSVPQKGNTRRERMDALFAEHWRPDGIIVIAEHIIVYEAEIKVAIWSKRFIEE